MIVIMAVISPDLGFSLKADVFIGFVFVSYLFEVPV
jgi:hypothetical protein